MSLRRHPVAWSYTPDRLDAIPLDVDLIARLRAVYSSVREHDLELAHVLYEKLFSTRPALRALFQEDVGRQAEKLMASLDAVISNLHFPVENSRMLAELGARHAQYGVQPDDYSIVIDLLVESLQEVLGCKASTSDLDEWRTALQLISRQMIEAAGARPVAPL